MDSDGREVNIFENFPECMLFEVLLRLPVKVLFRFMTVSKQWFSMISHRYFARTYAALSSPHSQPCWGIVKEVLSHHCWHRKDCEMHRVVFPSDKVLEDFDGTLLGFSNGLALYGEHWDKVHRIYVCRIRNLITGELITLPQYEGCPKHLSAGFVTQVEDNVLVSCRVVLIDYSGTDFRVRFAVYFSETCKWVDFDIDFGQEIFFISENKPVVVGKILHQRIYGHRLFAYDPYNKPDSFRLISLPGVERRMYTYLFNEHQGYLRYLMVAFGEREDEYGSLIIWDLRDYNRGEWCLQHRVGLGRIQPDGGGLTTSMRPLCFHPFDSGILYMVNDHVIFSYDIRTQTWKILYDANKYSRCGFIYMSPWHTFVIPPWPTCTRNFSRNCF
ncbi:F-box protein-like [Dorcoceras hygrometricum]|uniref:F-box protein-like n=1 Tax=Dorcoceras hygrometricum TaxID=472368 RepID=A0A2Z7DKP6_9LAMI|nr:F-box protein-like [Dorcoceras hygrometricum]